MNISPEDAARDLELVFALAGPVGSDLDEVSRTLADALKQAEYAVEEISVSALIRQIAKKQKLAVVDAPEDARIASLMNAGNAIRRMWSNPAALATAAVAEIRGRRHRATGGKPSRRAYVIRSLKRPEEVNLLRRIYGPGFFLIGVNVNRPARVESLAKHIARSHGETAASPHYAAHCAEAEALAKRDEDEEWDPYGQRLRDVFQLGDLFVSPSASLFAQIFRFVRLILGDLGETPFAEEQFMFQAFAASLSSGALGRQVGSVLVSPALEVLGIGWNDTPKGGGGLYRAGEHYDRRDIHQDRDSVNVHADQILVELLGAIRDAGWLREGVEPKLDDARAAFRGSRVMGLLEFGRTAHAEMEAILSAGRIRAGIRGATLYTTTFPCHECARLIVTAGVARVVYVEPYPKSRAVELHRDAILAFDDADAPHCAEPACSEPHTVCFEPFTGVGPHRYRDLFSITTGAGIRRDRKTRLSGERILWNAKTSLPRIEMLPLSYLDLEAQTLYQLKKIMITEKDGG